MASEFKGFGTASRRGVLRGAAAMSAAAALPGLAKAAGKPPTSAVNTTGLAVTDDTVTVIAARCGFGTAETMRRNFVRRMGVSPDQYRKTFA